MPDCIKCPQQEDCHSQSIGDLQMVRSIDGFLQTRNIVKAEATVKIFWKRLRERHEQLMGR